MKGIFLFGLFWIIVCFGGHCQVQQERVFDSLRIVLASAENDTVRLLSTGRIANIYSEINPDSAFYYSQIMLPIAQQFGLRLEEAAALGEMGYAQINLGNYPRSLQYLLSAICITSDKESEKNVLGEKFPGIDEFTDRTKPASIQRIDKLARIYQYAGILYGNSGNYEKALFYYKSAMALAKESKNIRIQCITHITFGRTYLALGKLDSALSNLQNAYKKAIDSEYDRYLGSILLNTGRVYMAKGETNTATTYFKKSIYESYRHEYFRGVVAANLALSEVFKKSGNSDSSFFYIKRGLDYASYLDAPDLYLRSYTALSDYFQSQNNSDSALKYQSRII